MSKNQAFMMNIKNTRKRNFGTNVEKKLWNFQNSWTFAYSHQSFNIFYNDILALH